ncbi:trifunctional purine biosynthetic protein adenosine-3-like [Orbicella faveolata]|uniref:trifunctional purine biosynthetic protein adenosine-3-like n=1 Tax=Orbicella faveolata TaxID=48498 RepID=UPI0009E3CAD4|nr:trifunctional purine biosynthetic protein adenosine-3-like [Orbicella faveolata]
MGDKVLIVGGGGREHAIAWKLAQSNHVGTILVAPGNAGTAGQPKTQNVLSSILNQNDNQSIVKYCVESKVDFVVIGPEAPLANGLGDCLRENNIPCFGPSRSAARIESSKQFAKEFMQRHNIPTARWKAFTDAEQACKHIELSDYEALVVKASGLAAGKGVVVAKCKEEAMKAVKDMLQDKIFGEAGSTIVVEEKLEGEEVSVLCFTDGKTVAVMPPAQDHKRLLDNDQGPNTGGMGAYAPCPQVSMKLKEEISRDVLQRAVDGLREEGCDFVGVLFAGIMLTADGPRVLEFNCRFGDPETQVIMPLLKSDLYATLMECVNGDLSLSLPLWHTDRYAVGVVAASAGYPGSVKKGCVIHGLKDLEDAENVVVFHAGTAAKMVEGKEEEAVVTSGGRVMAIVGLAQGINDAQKTAYDGMRKICFDGIQYRIDIASRACRTKGLTYSGAGVDVDAGNLLVNAIKPLAASTARKGCTADLGGFGGFFDLKAAGFTDPLLVSGTDGVGTKLKIAQAVGMHSSVGIDLVAMCVNDILAHGAEPLFFLDYFATGRLDVGVTKEVIRGISHGCSQAGCALLGGETAEMPGMYSSGEYDIAGFAVGAVDRDKVLPQSQSITTDDVVIGLASSGIHSNGFSLVRQIIDKSELSYSSPSPIRTTEGLQSVTKLGEVLLVPTRIYCRSVLPLMRDGKVKAFAHITGGGLIENIPRVLPDGMGVSLDASLWIMPPVFGWIFGQGNVSTHEMARTFNCGIGAVLIVAKDIAASVMEHFKTSEEQAWIIGKVTECTTENSSRVVVGNLEDVLCKSAAKAEIKHQVNANRVNGPAKRPKLSNGQMDQQPKDKEMKVGVLISGSGTNLQALIDQSLRQDSSAKIVLVISNVPGVQGLSRAEKAGIPTKVIKHKEFKSRLDFDMAVHAALEEAGVELVCLAGFMRIVTAEFVRKWHGRLLNVHPSLLPSFKGMHAHKLVLEAGVCISGCTVHFVEEEVDAGAIVTQEAVPVLHGDTVETLQERVKCAEHRAYPRAMELLASGRIKLSDDNKVQWMW